jgi:Trk-type K+ transport system membrane component
MGIAYFVLESSASFKSLGFVDRVNAAVFQSACARTSGFNLVDVSAMRPATLLLTCFAMFIGGNPGSTAGGIKTTTFAVLFAAYRGELRRLRPRLFDRTVPEPVIRRAMGVAFLSTSLVVTIVFLLLLIERHEPLALLFEAVSAFSTTGLSTGITATLSVPGKLLIIATMLIGRVGPLTMALALSAGARAPAYELPEERVMIG